MSSLVEKINNLNISDKSTPLRSLAQFKSQLSHITATRIIDQQGRLIQFMIDRMHSSAVLMRQHIQVINSYQKIPAASTQEKLVSSLQTNQKKSFLKVQKRFSSDLRKLMTMTFSSQNTLNIKTISQSIEFLHSIETEYQLFVESQLEMIDVFKDVILHTTNLATNISFSDKSLSENNDKFSKKDS